MLYAAACSPLTRCLRAPLPAWFCPPACACLTPLPPRPRAAPPPAAAACLHAPGETLPTSACPAFCLPPRLGCCRIALPHACLRLPLRRAARCRRTLLRCCAAPRRCRRALCALLPPRARTAFARTAHRYRTHAPALQHSLTRARLRSRLLLPASPHPRACRRAALPAFCCAPACRLSSTLLARLPPPVPSSCLLCTACLLPVCLFLPASQPAFLYLSSASFYLHTAFSPRSALCCPPAGLPHGQTL